MSTVRAIDLFCGAGGSSWGARNAGAHIVAGFDRWELAGKVYANNFPEAQFIPGRLEDHRQIGRITKSLGPIDLILASPECTNHSVAKGSAQRCETSKETAFQVLRFARVLQPRWIVIENVVSMKNWFRFEDFLGCLDGLGYHLNSMSLDASCFGVPQRRRRLFILCDREGQPPSTINGRTAEKPAKQIVDQNGTYRYVPLRAPGRAPATIARAQRAMRVLGKNRPFLIVYYGSDAAGGWQSLDAPLRTITTLDRFAFVKPGVKGHVMRMLQPPELQAAMGMPQRFRMVHGTRRERIMMIGNGVCPPVMERAVSQLIRSN